MLNIESLGKDDLNDYDPTKDEDVIIWSKDRKLTWNDFLGIPDSKNSHTALTRSIYYHKADPIIKKNGSECEFQLGNIKTYTLFRKSGSWVKLSFLTSRNEDQLLEHEQGHFDIGEIYRRIFEAELKKEVEKIHQCRGNSIEEIQKNADRKTEKILNRLGNIVLTKRNQYNEKYENETNHGIIPDIQKKYTVDIQTQLMNNPLDT